MPDRWRGFVSASQTSVTGPVSAVARVDDVAHRADAVEEAVRNQLRS
jgi:hypothetical protein